VLQHAALFDGALALTGAGLVWIDRDVSAWAIGLALWVVSALWGLAAYRGYLAPQVAGLSVACVGLLIGALITTGTAAGHALAVATVVGLLAVGAALRRILLLGFGAAGALVVLPLTADRYLPGSVTAALVVVAVGLALVGVALWLSTTRRSA
jgi:hypothetical protein